jgi:hypothetical protein
MKVRRPAASMPTLPRVLVGVLLLVEMKIAGDPGDR